MRVYDILTHKILYQVDAQCAPGCRISVLEQASVVCFDNADRKLVFFDCEQGKVRAISRALKTIRAPVYHGGEEIEAYTAWCEAGTSTVMQLYEGLRVQSYPYTNADSENREFLNSSYESIEGLFTPILGGGPSFSASSFSAMFTKALESKDENTLQ